MVKRYFKRIHNIEAKSSYKQNKKLKRHPFKEEGINSISAGVNIYPAINRTVAMPAGLL